MKYRLAAFSAALAVASLLTLSAPATADPAVTFTGLAGTKYQAVVTRTVLQAATATSPLITQPSLVVYKIAAGGRQKIWTAPPSVIPLVKRISKYPLGWFPLQIEIGPMTAAALVPDAGQQLLVRVHQAGADCGAASVHVIGFTGDALRELAHVDNYCTLSFAVAGSSVVFTGPGYKPTDALCCPSTPKAQATLRYASGAWKLTPMRFKLAVVAPG